jgi:hypothetical protein
MNGTIAGDAPGQNLAAFGNEISQEPGIFEVKNIYLFNAETADAAPAKAAARAATTLRRTTAIEIIVVVVTPPSVFIVCRHSHLVKQLIVKVNGESETATLTINEFETAVQQPSMIR